MRKLGLFGVMVALLGVAIVPASAQDEAGTIADIVVASATGENPEFTTLLAAVQAADPAVLEALADPEAELTVFAPTDAAFAALVEALGEEAFGEILADQEALTGILLYHVLDGAVFSADVVDAFEMMAEMEMEPAFTAETLNGQYLDISMDAEMGDVYIDNAKLSLDMVDIEAANGVIHVIDAVLVPETRTIAEIVVDAASDEEAPEFTTLLTAVGAADPALLEALSDPEAELTVFAPTDAAFAALDPALLNAALADQGLLTSVLQYHVVSGVVGSADVSALFEDGAESVDVPTLLDGANLTVSLGEDGYPVLNGTINIVITDIDAANGTIHVIDAVLVPALD